MLTKALAGLSGTALTADVVALINRFRLVTSYLHRFSARNAGLLHEPHCTFMRWDTLTQRTSPNCRTPVGRRSKLPSARARMFLGFGAWQKCWRTDANRAINHAANRLRGVIVVTSQTQPAMH